MQLPVHIASTFAAAGDQKFAYSLRVRMAHRMLLRLNMRFDGCL